MPQIPAGWYNDPARPGSVRWWDGTKWSDYPLPTQTSIAAQAIGRQVVATRPARRGASFGLVAILVAAVLVMGGSATLAIQVVAHGFSELAEQPRQENPTNPYTKGTSTSPPVPAPVVTHLTLPAVPGDAHEKAAGGILTEEGSEFTIESGLAERQKIDATCSPLTFDSPVAGGTRNSVNPVESFPEYEYESGDGMTTMKGGLQAFATAKDAENFMSDTSTLVRSCTKAFKDSGGQDKVLRTTASYPAAGLNSWSQTVKSPGASFVVRIVDIRDGRFVARSYCRQSSVTSGSTALCSAWTSAVAQSAASAG
jgi:hypothetical protein